MNTKIILASASPRRIDILKEHGLTPEIIPANIDETLPFAMDRHEAVKFLAHKKGASVESYLKNTNQFNQNVAIISADTIVYKDKILGKPKDRNDAMKMLLSFSGTYHYVTTGVSIICPKLKLTEVFSVDTKVFCKYYTKNDIEAYLNTNEPYDKAGAYAIQGIFGRYIDHYEGYFDNVVGLPWVPLKKKLQLYKLID